MGRSRWNVAKSILCCLYSVIYDLIYPLTGRPTGIPEKDICLNEARYDEEEEEEFRKLKGLHVIRRFVLLIMSDNVWS